MSPHIQGERKKEVKQQKICFAPHWTLPNNVSMLTAAMCNGDSFYFIHKRSVPLKKNPRFDSVLDRISHFMFLHIYDVYLLSL